MKNRLEELRRARGLRQEELADALEVNVADLLAGRREELPAPVPPEVEDVVVDAVAYAETARRKRDRWRWWTFVALTSGCLIAALVLMIVGAAHGSMWAALLVIKCIAFGWAVCYPLLRTEKPVRNTLIIASAGVYPFLCSLGVRDLRALGIVILSAAFAWAVYGIWLKCRNRQKSMILMILLGILLHISINAIVIVPWGAANSVFFVTLFTLVLDALCLWGAWAVEKVRFFRRR